MKRCRGAGLLASSLVAVLLIPCSVVAGSAPLARPREQARGQDGERTDPMRALVAAMIGRIGVADAVAAAKYPDGPITDSQREKKVLADMAVAGERLGLAREQVVLVFGDQIAAATYVERVDFAQWAHSPVSAAAHKPDLVHDVRPRIDAYNEAILDGLANTTGLRHVRGCATRTAITAWMLAIDGRLDGSHRHALSRAVRHVCSARP